MRHNRIADICLMNVLIVAATPLEIEPIVRELRAFHLPSDVKLDTCITGVGSMKTAYHLTSSLTKIKPDLAIQLGIAGAFVDAFPPGSTVAVGQDLIGDLGVKENGVFLDLFDLGLMTTPPHQKEFANPFLKTLPISLPAVKGITVNQISNQEQVKIFADKYNPEIETMEGAAFHYVCLQEQVPFVQIRAISNRVGERDKSKWKVDESVGNLKDFFFHFIQKYIAR